VAPLNPGNDDAVEYDAQGRRLITIAVDLESDARAVNTSVAKMNIDFYEVVFVRTEGAVTEYYSATTPKGAGKQLSLRVPVIGTYKAYLNAGDSEDSDNAVLLAQAKDDGSGSGYTDVKREWTFALTALDLRVNGPNVAAGNNADSTDPIKVQISGSAGKLYVTTSGIPYYKLSTVSAPVVVTVKTGVTNVAAYGTNYVSVMPLGSTSPIRLPELIAAGTAPAYVPADGILTFGFTTPSVIPEGLSNIGFDVTVALADYTTRKDGAVKPIRWHIRNGLDVEKYDKADNTDPAATTNTGAGLVFAWGNTIPTLDTDTTGVSLLPPPVL
jgi:hypothetical protein